MPTDRTEVAHLLRRAAFGGNADEIDRLATLDRGAIVDQLLDWTSAPADDPPPPVVDPSKEEWERMQALLEWWLDRMATTPTPLQEKLTLFWHGHFVSSAEKISKSYSMWEQLHIYRSLAGGNYRELCQRMAVSPAMLVYLDNYTSESGHANENFARELMELFTLGANQYTQDDVVAAARAWTGHSLDDPEADRPRYVFKPALHDQTSKTFFGISKNWDGPQIIDEILTGQKRQIAARFIAARLWSFFAYPGPSASLVDELANVLLASTYELRPLLRAIFTHDEFFSARAKMGRVRSPVEFTVAATRASGVPMATANPWWWMDEMGQKPLYPPNVSGWKTDTAWLSESAFWSKASFASHLKGRAYDAGALASTRTMSVSDAVTTACNAAGIIAPTFATRSELETWLAEQRAASQSEWDAYEQMNLLHFVFMTPQFQLA